MPHRLLTGSVLEAADGIAVRLSDRVPADTSLARGQVPSPGISSRLCRRPEVRVRTQIGEPRISKAPDAGEQGVKIRSSTAF